MAVGKQITLYTTEVNVSERTRTADDDAADDEDAARDDDDAAAEEDEAPEEEAEEDEAPDEEENGENENAAGEDEEDGSVTSMECNASCSRSNAAPKAFKVAAGCANSVKTSMTNQDIEAKR